MVSGRLKEGPLKRFSVKYQIDVRSACWIWVAGCMTSGYGQFYDGTRDVGAHRWSYKNFIGEIPENLEIDHLCENKLCVNPEHLEAVSRQVNMKRYHTNHRAYVGQRSHCKNGHPMCEDNTYRSLKTGLTFCKTCRKTNRARYKLNISLDKTLGKPSSGD